MKKYWLLVVCSLFIVNTKLIAQTTSENELDYKKFIETVQENNISYTAERFNVDIAETEILSAKAFADPELQFEYFDNGEAKRKMGLGYSAEVGWVLELGGKRKARINLAKSEFELTKLILLDYFKNLKADATLGFLQTIYQKEMLNVKENSYNMMNQLANSDEIRFKLGEISETDARQSRLETQSLKNEIIQAETDFATSKIRLSTFMGIDQYADLFSTVGDLKTFQRDFNLINLTEMALSNRTDLLVALQSKDVSQRMIELAKANRVIDLGLILGLEHSTAVRNLIAETPQFTQIKGGISIPLKFSNKYNNELKVAKMQFKQEELNYKQTELEIKSQVKEAYELYEGYKKQLKQFDIEILKNANLILEAKKYSYKRGNSSLLEVLDAQRTYNETQNQYLETLYNCASGLIDLERVVGIWDIDF
ncbi:MULTISPECIES: TolC family protein [unclassified Empedobacter]|uniref:TolC family protein n=1 Tax=unclassified Empedobacter TaxID=2643773 RepID=UPI0025C57BD6|nr:MULTISPECIES: TolC family protein [unclassified Empedobacter]